MVAVNPRQMTLFNYKDYDLVSSFTAEAQQLPSQFLEELRRDFKSPYTYVTRMTKSGPVVEVEVYPVFRGKDAPKGIVAKEYKAQKKLNDLNSQREFVRYFNTNFGLGDLVVHLTYDDAHLPESKNIERLKKDWDNFLKALKRWSRKKGIPMPVYMYVLGVGGYGEKRHHIHAVFKTALDRDLIESLWKKGTAKTERLQRQQATLGFTGKAEYLAKHIERYKKTKFRLKGERIWGKSNGLKKPTVSMNRTKFKSKKKVEALYANQGDLKEIFEKAYPNLEYKEGTAKANEHNGFVYVRVVMEPRAVRRI